ncbi:glycosyltransferase [Candidatus Berkelbacteria bacterium]|nr:glycosyltransferase [Candidatus Berkelbacteria bacterium]
MKRPVVLMLSYLYPPSPEVGAMRVSEFARYLPEFGWQPVVVTSRDGLDVAWSDPSYATRTPPTIFEHLIGWFRRSGRSLGPYRFSEATGTVQSSSRLGLALGRMAMVWLRGWWAVHAIPTALRLGRSRHICAIYVNCGPFGPTLTGLVAKLLLHRPLVLDFRDAWSLDPYGRFGPVGRTWSWLWESVILRFTDRLLLTSPSARTAYLKRYPFLHGRCHCLPNGYDEAFFANLPKPTDPYPGRTLGYAGTIYPERFEPLLRGLALVPDLTLHLYGRIFAPEALWALADRYNLRPRIVYHGFLPRRELLSELQRLRALVLTQEFWGATTVSPIAGKTYEYLRLGLPILGLMPAGDNATLLRRYGKNVVVVTRPAPRSVARGVRIVLGKRRLEARGLPFSRQTLTGQLATILDSLPPTTRSAPGRDLPSRSGA